MKKYLLILAVPVLALSSGALASSHASTDPCASFPGNWHGNVRFHEYNGGKYIGDCIYQSTGVGNRYQSAVSFNLTIFNGSSPQGIKCYPASTSYTGTCNAALLKMSGAFGNVSGTIINNKINLEGSSSTGSTYTIAMSK